MSHKFEIKVTQPVHLFKTYYGRIDAINSILATCGMDRKSRRKTFRVPSNQSIIRCGVSMVWLGLIAWYFIMPTRFGEKTRAKRAQTFRIPVLDFDTSLCDARASLPDEQWLPESQRIIANTKFIRFEAL